LRSFGSLLSSCPNRQIELLNLQTVVEERHGDISLGEWLRRISLQVPGSETPTKAELKSISTLLDGSEITLAVEEPASGIS